MSHETRINAIRAGLNRPLVLVGMPAAGKTALGRRLSQLLGAKLIDLDRAIEEEAGQTIPALFENAGEAAFRDLESAMLHRVLDGAPGLCVLSTGGGVVLRQENRELIFGRGLAIWVRAPIPVLLERVARNTNRPLLRNGDPEKTLRELEAARLPLYSEAPIAVDTGGAAPEQVIAEIITKIYERLS